MKQLLPLLGLLLSISNSFGHDLWSFYGGISTKNNTNCTIHRRYSCNANYDVASAIIERNRQDVWVQDPEQLENLKNDSDSKIIIEEFDAYLICQKTKTVIETKIEGAFEGWHGDTIWKMTNGQIWQQANQNYMYQYLYNPKVLIYRHQDSWIMQVEGVNETIEVEKLN